MKPRRTVLLLHLAVGLIAAILLFVMGLSGAMIVFEKEIHFGLNAKLFRAAAAGKRLSLDRITAHLEGAHPGMKVGFVSIPEEADVAWVFTLRSVGKGAPLSLTVDPYTGIEIGSLERENRWMARVHQFHTNLLLGPPGKIVTGWGAAFLLVLAISGLVLWWPQKIWTISRAASGRRLSFALHNAAGFDSSIFLLLFGATGLIVHWDEATVGLVDRLTGSAGPRPIPRAAIHAGVNWLSAQGAMEAAEQSVPGARVATIQGIGTPSGVRVTMKFPEDRTPAGRTNVYLDPATGVVLWRQDSRTAPIGIRVAKLWNREIHTGDIWGWPSRILACVASLLLPLLAVTGLMLWCRRRRK